MKRQKAFSLLQLLIEVVITLFIAGIVVPSFLRSDVAAKEALAGGSLHSINIAGVVLSYTNQNVEFAILGGLVGAMAAFVIPFSQCAQELNLYANNHSAGRASPALKLCWDTWNKKN